MTTLVSGVLKKGNKDARRRGALSTLKGQGRNSPPHQPFHTLFHLQPHISINNIHTVHNPNYTTHRTRNM